MIPGHNDMMNENPDFGKPIPDLRHKISKEIL